MLSGAIYVVRAAAALFVGAVGLILLASSLLSKDRTAWTIGISTAIALAGLLAWPRRPNAWRHDPPTDRQLAFARDLGIQVPAGISKGDLSEMISQAKAVRDQF
jgi:hypothetical protein